jgi:hypothetical protein
MSSKKLTSNPFTDWKKLLLEIQGTFIVYKASLWHYGFKDDQEILDNKDEGLEGGSHGMFQGYTSAFTRFWRNTKSLSGWHNTS